MDKKEKSIALAKLMGWRIFDEKHRCHFEETEGSFRKVLNPYSDLSNGLIQFAAILLRFPEVMCLWVRCSGSTLDEVVWDETIMRFKPTQENILDEILRMNGIEA